MKLFIRYFFSKKIILLTLPLFVNLAPTLSHSKNLRRCAGAFKSIDIVRRAHIFSKKAHDETGEKRRFDGRPYFTHPLRVAKLVSKYTRNKELIAAAYLHDILENTPYTYEEIKGKFGVRVADLVKELTSDTEVMEQFNSKGVYLAYKMTLMSLDALLIKLADRLDNVSDFAFADADFLKSYREETKLIIDVVSGRTDLKATHLKLIEKINSALTLSDSFS